ncbi:MAG: peptide chain release factor N(5)-glutamine methyltransferase, partial [Proteobacteria bacterium]
MNVKQALAEQAGFRRDAEALLLHCLGREDRAWLIAHDTDELPEAVVTEFEQLCQQRRSGTPLAYLLGFREFWSLKLKVSPDVLIPRPETEYLVEWAIEISERQGCSSLLDLGTGSGAIALAIKSACPQLEVTATDASAGALAIALENAEALGLPIKLEKSDWCSDL